MNFEKIKTDFEKRYDKKCEKIYFAGLGIELFSENANTLSGCVSLGEAMAVSSRDDGRITVQFSGSDSATSFNITDVDAHLGTRVGKLLKNAMNCGVKLGGADIFIFKNSRITDLIEPLILGGLSAFCEKVPRKEILMPRFDEYKKNMITLSGKSKSATLFDGQTVRHLPFFGGKCKIVITYGGKETVTPKLPKRTTFQDAVIALKKGDMEKFGYLLSKDCENLLTENKGMKSEGMFQAAKTTKDALGSGIMPGGGVFSVVQNSKVDRFIHGVSVWHQKYLGGVPDSYVTDFVDSGFFVD